MNIYIGNLSYDCTEAELTELFAAFGEVKSVRLITDRETGRAKGFGFVEMGTREAGEQAIAALNGTENRGRAMLVNEARPKPERSAGGGGDRSGFRPRGGRPSRDRDY